MDNSNNPLKMISEPNSNWYSEGLSFECTGCGQCCTGAPGYVWISEEEILLLAKHLKLSPNEFAKKYLRKIGQRFSLKEDSRNFDCIFLKNNKCEVYALRPKQCRTFPWWPQNLKSKEDWEEAAKRCEGIQPKAPKVSYDIIQEQLAIHMDSHDH